jgi:periplasmic protein TonB
MQSLLLALSIATGAPAAHSVSPPSADAAREACPAPYIDTPRYPADMARKNIAGTVVAIANIDDCGRVLAPRIYTSSGHRELDEAALAAVRSWVLNPAQRAKATGGIMKLPVAFGVP